MKIQLCKHVKGRLPDEVLELDLSSGDYKRITEHPLVSVQGTTYMRDGRDRSVYFDVEVLDLTTYLEFSGMK